MSSVNTTKGEAMFTEAEREAMFLVDVSAFLKEREKQSGSGANIDTIIFATSLMLENRTNNAILSLLHRNEIEVRVREGRDGSDIDDFEMRPIDAAESTEATR
jgi:hypothetical protein